MHARRLAIVPDPVRQFWVHPIGRSDFHVKAGEDALLVRQQRYMDARHPLRRHHVDVIWNEHAWMHRGDRAISLDTLRKLFQQLGDDLVGLLAPVLPARIDQDVRSSLDAPPFRPVGWRERFEPLHQRLDVDLGEELDAAIYRPWFQFDSLT